MKSAFDETSPLKDSKPWAGKNDELAVILQQGMNAWDASVYHLKNWNLKSFLNRSKKDYDQPLTHEFTHLLYGYTLAALQNIGSTSLAAKREDNEYQGHMNGEAIVTVLQQQIFRPLFSDPKNFKIPSLGRLMEAFRNPDDNIIGSYNFLGKDAYRYHFSGAYYIGKITGKTIQEVREENRFDDVGLYRAARTLAKERGEEELFDNLYMTSFQAGEDWTYTAANGKKQVIPRMLRNPAEDPDTELILKAMMPGLQYLISCVQVADRTRGWLPLTERRIGQSIDMRTLFVEIISHLTPQIAQEHLPHIEILH